MLHPKWFWLCVYIDLIASQGNLYYNTINNKKRKKDTQHFLRFINSYLPSHVSGWRLKHDRRKSKKQLCIWLLFTSCHIFNKGKGNMSCIIFLWSWNCRSLWTPFMKELECLGGKEEKLVFWISTMLWAWIPVPTFRWERQNRTISRLITRLIV